MLKGFGARGGLSLGELQRMEVLALGVWGRAEHREGLQGHLRAIGDRCVYGFLLVQSIAPLLEFDFAAGVNALFICYG